MSLNNITNSVYQEKRKKLIYYLTNFNHTLIVLAYLDIRFHSLSIHIRMLSFIYISQLSHSISHIYICTHISIHINTLLSFFPCPNMITFSYIFTSSLCLSHHIFFSIFLYFYLQYICPSSSSSPSHALSLSLSISLLYLFLSLCFPLYISISISISISSLSLNPPL